MPRPKALVPSLRFHISGSAICEIAGTTYYLGRHGSPESLARYAVLIREYQANGLVVPSHITSASLQELTAGFAVPVEKVDQSDEPIRVDHLVEAYRQHVVDRYASQPHEVHRLCSICDDLKKNDGSKLANEYGPRALQSQRQRWVDAGNKSRPYINRLVAAVVRMYRWGVAQELCSNEAWQRLKSVEPLRQGYTEAYDREPVLPVSLDVVRKTAKELSPIVRDMLQIQLMTAMRPQELCDLRLADIDRTGDIWVYKPPRHKNKGKGKSRSIPLIEDARKIIENYLNRPPTAPLFSPKESVAWFRAKQRIDRKTSVQPSQRNRKKDAPAKEPGTKYTPTSYRQSIQRAAKRAGVEPWHPYRVRHLALTTIRETLGIEAAQAVAGHSRVDMTTHYAKSQLNEAVKGAQAAPKL